MITVTPNPSAQPKEYKEATSVKVTPEGDLFVLKARSGEDAFLAVHASGTWRSAVKSE